MTIHSARINLLAALMAAGPAHAAERSAQDAKAREILARTISFHTSVGLGQVLAMAGPQPR